MRTGMAAITLLAAPAHAIVNTGAIMDNPADAVIGRWNGSTGIAVDEHWVLTALHVKGNPNRHDFRHRGVDYDADLRITHGSTDLAMIRLVDPLPNHHRVSSTLDLWQRVVIGGMGVTGDASTNFQWTGPRVERWGANVVNRMYADRLGVMIDGGQDADHYEAGFAQYDSGAGAFLEADDGSLELVGIALSASRLGETRVGDYYLLVDVTQHIDWINGVMAAHPIDDPDVPAPPTIALAALAILASAPRSRRD